VLRIRVALTALLITVAAPATASADRLLPPESGPTFQATGAELVAFDGYVYFAANNGVVGNELWRTDGTAAGTTLVKDFNPGAASANGNPRDFKVVGNRLFLTASSPGEPAGTYVIDPGGTPQPTSIPGGAPGAVASGSLYGAVNNKVLLRHYNGSSYNLYSLGQTGTVFTQITAGDTISQTGGSATLNGWAYYAQAEGANSAFEPWRTDGTTAQKVKDIRPGSDGSQPGDFFATGNRVYFVADDGTHGRELWVTDGTEGGTQLVREHHPLSTGSSISHMAANGNVLYYVPNDAVTGAEVWRTEGTAATTRVVKDINPGSGGIGVVKPFAFKNGFGMLRGAELWVSDGTDAGTKQIGRVDNDGYGPGHEKVVGSRIYFRGGYSGWGSVVWRSDGTAAGTFALTAGAFDGVKAGHPYAGPFAQLGSKVIFTAQYPHAAGDPLPSSVRRVYAIDTSQPDITRRATSAPTISGTPAVGQALRGDKGIWTLEPNRYAYQWLRNGTPIPNAKADTYRLNTADAGAEIRFRVTATGIGGPNVAEALSAPVVVGAAANPQPAPTATPAPAPAPAAKSLTVKKKPKLTGAAKVGKTVKLTLPKFAQPGTKLTFRWYANGKLIRKQAKSSLKLTNALKGKRITATITVKKAGFKTLTLTVGLKGKVKRR
jgi:ELWxxDGT repeat protein